MSGSGEDHEWMRRALAWARLAARRGEVPVGCVVVRGGEILGGAHDGKETFRDPTAHSEVLAIREAAARTGDWRLDGATLYVTLEPCAMCAGAIVHARIARVVFAAANPRWGISAAQLPILQHPLFNHRVEVTAGVLAEDSAALLRDTFRAYRVARACGEDPE